MRCLIPIVIGLCLAASAEIILPPMPENWQREVTPGFDPSIESVIENSRGCDYLKTSFRESLTKWGPEAIPVIIRLYEDSTWNAVRYVLIQMLAQSSSEEASTYLLKRFDTLTAILGPSEQDISEMRSLCKNLVDFGPNEFRTRLLTEARSGNSAYAVAYISGLHTIGDDEALRAMIVLRGRLMRPRTPADVLDDSISQLRGQLRGEQFMDSVTTADREPVHKVAPEIRQVLKNPQMETNEYKVAGFVTQLVNREGDKSIGFLSELAKEGTVSTETRRQAAVGLGLVGTEKSVKAYVRLRDAAFHKEWAPKRKERYTHAEKIAEAAAMTVNVIPDDHPIGVSAEPIDWALKTAWVSEDFATGSIRWQGYDVRARRFGSEWLVVSAQRMPIP